MPSDTTIVIGARGSRLAQIQAIAIQGLLADAFPERRFEVRSFTTTGDRILDTPLPLMGGKGVFTDAIEAALLSGEIDFAVHSLKDLPVEQRAGLCIAAVPERGPVVDAFITRDGSKLSDLPPGARVGTSSLRRGAQLQLARPGVEPVSIRGNVETRLRKLDVPDQGYDAIILAMAGLHRLDLTSRATETLSLDLMLPAPGQGALAVQCRDEPPSRAMAAAIDHPPTAMAVAAERAFLLALGGGCSAPIAAYAELFDDELLLRGRIAAVDGSVVVDVDERRACASVDGAMEIARDLAAVAIARGAGDLLEDVS